MSPMQQIFLGLGAVAEKTYVDDVFSTFLYKGTGSAKTVTTGIDQSGEGSLTWIKKRDGAVSNHLYDTVRGAGKGLSSDLSSAEYNLNTRLSGFTSTGFTLGNNGAVNANGGEYSSWNFRKAPGFFDIQEYSSGSSNTSGSIGNPNFQVNHDLGCAPGMILIKRTNSTNDWFAWVRGKEGVLNSTGTLGNASALPLADVTSTYFKFSAGNGSYNDPGNFIAYIFAGGEDQTTATARSVEFDGSNDYLSIPDNNAWDISSSDATIECWVNFDSHNGHDGIIHNLHSSGLPGNGTSGWALEPVSGIFNLYWGTTAGGYGNVQGAKIPLGQWQHLAVTKSGSTITLYQDGVKTGSGSISGTINPGVVPLNIGGNCVGEYCDCKISNVRITKGQVLYTSSFKPSTVPLTTTSQGATASNVKLLCCNNSSATGSSVTPDTITNNNGSTASTDSPFDDPAGFVFGDAGDQNLLKVGSYVGNGNADGPDVFLGWEPQWLMVKRVDSADEWPIYDSMRGIVTGGNDSRLYANQSAAEYSTNANYFALTPTGFKVSKASGEVNASGGTYIYFCIRRPDGYVGKPIELGTGAFTMDWGNSTSTESWTSGFPVDYAIYRRTHYVTDWFASARLMQGKELTQNTTAAESAWTGAYFDSNTAWGANAGMDTTYLSYMWKRHKGFDVQRYTGKTGQQSRVHGLNAVPEMIWVKSTNNAYEWAIGHKDLTSGWTSKHLRFTNSGEITGQQFALAPTATHWTTPNGGLVNDNGEEYIAMLFSSITGVSAVGSYTGSGGVRWINVGFQPRFLLIKRTDGTGDWLLVDSMRGVDKNLYLNTTAANSGGQQIQTNSTSFAITALGANEYNVNNEEYIYYCHA